MRNLVSIAHPSPPSQMLSPKRNGNHQEVEWELNDGGTALTQISPLQR